MLGSKIFVVIDLSLDYVVSLGLSICNCSYILLLYENQFHLYCVKLDSKICLSMLVQLGIQSCTIK